MLHRSDQELVASVKISEQEARQLKQKASIQVYPWQQKHHRVSDILESANKPDHISLGDTTLDFVLNGGVRTRAITEVVGQRYYTTQQCLAHFPDNTI